MTGEELAAFVSEKIKSGEITTYKRLEEETGVSRSTVTGWIRKGKYVALRIKAQWILIKQ